MRGKMERVEEGKEGRKEKKVIGLILAQPRYFTSWHKFLHTRPFPSSPGLCLKTRVGAETLIWKSFFILMQIKLIFTRKVVHLATFWKWGFLELGSGLLARRSKRSLQKGRFSLKRPIWLDSHNFAQRFNCRVRTESLILERILKFA